MHLSFASIIYATAGMLLCLILAAGSSAAEQDPVLPKPGMAYAQARESLLNEGLRIAPDRPKAPDARYPELDCSGATGAACRALFISTTQDGWGQYIVVSVNGSDAKVVKADFARPVDGLISIPPAEPPDVPQIKGPYLRARQTLRRLGYKPLKVAGGPAKVCADKVCQTFTTFPEAKCPVDIPVCNTFWAAPDGKVLRVMTVGEVKLGRVYYVNWSTREEAD